MEKRDKDFWHDHSKELMGLSALGLAGLATALASSRTRRHKRSEHSEEIGNTIDQPEDLDGEKGLS